MKKIIFFIVLFAAALVAAPFYTASGQQQQAAAWKLLLAIPAGKQAGAVAYRSQAGYGRMQGPEAFTVAADGSIYVLDSVNRRILYKPKGQAAIRAIDLPGVYYPKDIAAESGSLTILDDSNRVLRYSAKGQKFAETMLPAGMKSEQVYGLMESGGKVKLWAANSNEFDLNALPAAVELNAPGTGKGLGPGISAPDGTRWQAMFDGLTQGLFITPDGSRKIVVAAYGLFGSARLVGFDKQSNLYILAEDLYDAAPDKLGVEMSIRKYAPDGALLGAAVFPIGEALVPSSHPVQVTANGQVYAMIAAKQALSIYAVTLGKNYHPKAWRAPLDAGVSRANETLQAQPSVTTSHTRIQVFNDARAMTTVTWTWRSIYDWINGEFNNGTDLKRSALGPGTKPAQLNSLVDGSVATGIPYYWGGFDSPWTKSDWATAGNITRWTNWGGALNYYRNKTPSQKGPLVGNTIASGNPQRGGAGLDCSGFVAAAIASPPNGTVFSAKPGTGALASDAYSYNWRTGGDTLAMAFRRLQPMNFLASGDHTLYYTRRSLDLSGISTLEATTAGINMQGAKAYSRILSDLQSFAFHRSWWPMAAGDSPEKALPSKGAGSACHGLAGQAVWYKFTVPAGARNVTLTGISGGDPDLYVYTAAFGTPVSSFHTGVTNESVSISAAGTYYAMVHIWTTGGCVSWMINW